MSTRFDHEDVMPAGAPRRETASMLLVAAALGWGLLILIAAMTVPVVTVQAPAVTATATATASPSPSPSPSPSNDTGDGQIFIKSPRVSVLRHDGLAGVAVAGVPAVISVIVAGLVFRSSRSRRGRPLAIAAWTLSIALVVSGIVGFVTILVGVVAIPPGVLLVVACSQAQWGRRANSVISTAA